MTDEIARLKARTREYVAATCEKLEQKQVNPKLCCPNPGHTDTDPSATFYDGVRVTCHVCDQSWDIFALAGLHNGLTNFADQIKHVREFFGVSSDGPPKTAGMNQESTKKAGRPPLVPHLLSKEDARKEYSTARLMEFAGFIKLDDAKIVKAWPYKTAKGEVAGVDVRYSHKNKRGKPDKSVITFWFDGKSIRAKNPPKLLYNLDNLAAYLEAPVLIVEGAKCAEIAKEIPGFIPVSWSGGSKKYDLPDWSPLAGRNVYIYPDDDEPGLSTGNKLAALLRKEHGANVTLVVPLPEARTIKKKGADIEEALQILKPDELAEWIKLGGRSPKSEPKAEPKAEQKKNQASQKKSKPSQAPASRHGFRIFGTADDGTAFFENRAGRIVNYDTATLTSTKLLTLADLKYWALEHPGMKTEVNWTACIDDVIGASEHDFDQDSLRGRGAWKEKDGRICYHDGRETVGEWDESRVFVRKTRRNIGLSSVPLDDFTRQQIMKEAAKLPFDTHSDAVRILGWSALAPFCGALFWRPAGLITGASGVGKTFILDNIVRRLAAAAIYPGEATPAGIMQDLRNDAVAVIIEESEAEDDKQRFNRKGQFSLMRQSTSDDTPKMVKGTADQRGIKYDMKSMFLYSGISSAVESVADENRIFRCRIVKGKKVDWSKAGKEFDRLLTDENADRLRAFTWANLKEILALVERITPIIQEETGKDHRWAKSEGLLLSAYIIIWKAIPIEKITDILIKDTVAGFYKSSPIPETRDESVETVEKLLDQIVRVDFERNSEMLSMREILSRVRNGSTMEIGGGGQEREMVIPNGMRTVCKRIAANHGLGLSEGVVMKNVANPAAHKKELAISFGHPEIMKILGKGAGYQEELARHPGTISRFHLVSMGGKSRNCVVIGGLLDVEGQKQMSLSG